MGPIQREAYLRGALNFLGSWVGHIPDEIFLLVNYFFNTTHASNRVRKCDITKVLFLEYFKFGSGF